MEIYTVSKEASKTLDEIAEAADAFEVVYIETSIVGEITPNRLLSALGKLAKANVKVYLMENEDVCASIDDLNTRLLMSYLSQSAELTSHQHQQRALKAKNNGRPTSKLTKEQLRSAYNATKDSTFTKAQIAEQLNVSRPTLNTLLPQS